jgi:hypothetical protein
MTPSPFLACTKSAGLVAQACQQGGHAITPTLAGEDRRSHQTHDAGFDAIKLKDRQPLLEAPMPGQLACD